MFVGHFAVALAAKRADPKLQLGVLFAAVQLLDILWPVLVVAGVEHARIVPGITASNPLDLYDMPYSHSLAASLLWSVLFALPWWLWRERRAALIVAACVFSHFILDWISHRPDLQLAPGLASRYGLGLWNSFWGAIVVEGGLFVLGIGLYVMGTRATNRWGSIGFWALMLLLLGGWLSGPFGPPPPNIAAVTVPALFVIPLLLLWAWAVDRGRVSRAG